MFGGQSHFGLRRPISKTLCLFVVSVTNQIRTLDVLTFLFFFRFFLICRILKRGALEEAADNSDDVTPNSLTMDGFCTKIDRPGALPGCSFTAGR